MLNKSIASLLLLLTVAFSMPLQAANSPGYWYDSATKNIVRSGHNKCWRTIDWSTSNAIAECEGKTNNDSDNDGVIDRNDKCSGTPRGTKVDARGCASNNDADNDGITDANDYCPNTASGTVVNNRGCKLKANINLDNVQFKSGTAVLSAESITILDNVAETLNDNKHLNFEVAGHTDNRGNYRNNVNLSKSRAKSVRQHLINNGVAAQRLTSRGYGPDKPAASNATAQGRSKNRRVVLILR